jgi:hypothetical protein
MFWLKKLQNQPGTLGLPKHELAAFGLSLHIFLRQTSVRLQLQWNAPTPSIGSVHTLDIRIQIGWLLLNKKIKMPH